MRYNYVIIGGGLAGGRACQGIRREDSEGSVALVTAEKHGPYQRPPLSKGYLTGSQDLDKVLLKPDGYYSENQIDLLTGVRAAEIRPDAHQVVLEDGRAVGYNKLLLATGGRAWRLPLRGADLRHVYTLRRIEDADAIRSAAQRDTRALVMGGSFIGSEVAASLAQRGARVVMVFPESRLLGRIAPEEMSAFLRRKFESHGVQILPGTTAESLEGDDAIERAVLDNGESLEFDLAVMGVGIRLNTELARDAGLELRGGDGAVVVDQFLRTSNPDIYAAGDIAAWPDPTFGKQLRVEHWDVAYNQGMRAGRNMAGPAKPYTTLPYFFSDLFDLSFEVWGDLSAWDQTVRRGTLKGGSFGFYYFSQGRLVGVLALGRPEEERDPMQALVKARPSLDAVARGLADEGQDLRLLLG
jgi:3-phenylpropionate/trans-cinnamate dioxygenase ferredoxin reductase subunit